MSAGRKVIVLGSLIIDRFHSVDHLPLAGETILSSGTETKFGGKGANQAVAAARLGAEVEMIGAAGDDPAGGDYLARLADFGVGCYGVLVKSGEATGSATIALAPDGENLIIVSPGANSILDPEWIAERSGSIRQADCLLVQNEVPSSANRRAVEIARAAETQIIYNPAPWVEGIGARELPADVLILNEVEAEGYFGMRIDSAGEIPARDGITILTRGAEPVLVRAGEEVFEVNPPRVEPVDTVGAGDTFCGAFAAMFSGDDLRGAVELATRAASQSILKLGAQEGMPHLEELES